MRRLVFMRTQRRPEKQTLKLDAAIVARGPRAVLLADQISRLGGELTMTDTEVTYTVPECHLEAAEAAVTAYCTCGLPAEILVPTGPDFEGASLECRDCVTTFEGE